VAAETKLAVIEVITVQEGEYTVATARLEGAKGVGTSRKEAKAVSYALEDLAAKLRAAA
jgi:hypothetical protein